MKTRSYIIGLALIVLLAGACFVQAEPILSYDFEGLSDGTLLGQDTPAWTSGFPAVLGDFAVGDVVGADGNTSKAIYRDPAIWDTNGTTYNVRDWPTSVSFTSTDTAVWQSFQLKLNIDDKYQGLQGSARFGSMSLQRVIFGTDAVDLVNPVDKWYLRVGGGTSYWGGSDIVDDHWYEVKLVMDFSYSGGRGTLYHRDLTMGWGWVQDISLTDVPLGITQTAGEYVVTGLNFQSADRQESPPAGWIDNYVLVPEPGTLVLLATGLIGLLCYAWRKRK